MIPGFAIRCAAGAALLLAGHSSALSARVLHAPGGGTVRALVMGIDKYPNLNEASQLHGAASDAKDLTAALKNAGVPGVNVRMLRDGEAVRSRVIAEMDRLVNESKAGDLVIITYSGHGMRVRGYKRWDGKSRSGVHSQMALSNFSPADVDNGHEVIVDAEMRAWYARLDAKGVDVLVVMDTCYGGHMRQVEPNGGEMRLRVLNAEIDNRIHDTFVPIAMTEREAGADANEMRHLTFFAGAIESSTVPEMSGVDRANRSQPRGALSYYMARVIDGRLAAEGSPDGKATAMPDGAVTRLRLFKFLGPNVREATNSRQIIDYGPRTDSEDAAQQVIFRIDDDGRQRPNPPVAADGPQPPKTPAAADAGLQSGQGCNPLPSEGHGEPVRVAITNGLGDSFGAVTKGRAPFIRSETAEADVIWDVGNGKALSRGDLIMEQVDASVLGEVIDRTFAVREIKKLAAPRIIDVRMGENGKAYTIGDQPTLVADGVRDSYLTVVNIAADATVQLLFPVFAGHEPHMTADQWRYSPRVDLPYGTDDTVVISTGAPAADLTCWLRAHNGKHDAYDLPAVLARQVASDDRTRLGTAGLFTTHSADSP